MTKIELAATIMLGRENDGKLEILLVRRNKALAFAGGLWVFPGGKIEENELEETQSELEAAKVAAVRETKEEVDLAINASDLIFFRHWTTPLIESRRFAAYFFFGSVNQLGHKVKIDDSEIKDHIWIEPEKALEKIRKAEYTMLPPTILSLQFIRKCKSINEVIQLLNQEEPIYVLPVLEMKGSTMLSMYKGDAGYHSNDTTVQGSRHRFIYNMEKGDFDFEYKDCSERPVNGNMHL